MQVVVEPNILPRLRESVAVSILASVSAVALTLGLLSSANAQTPGSPVPAVVPADDFGPNHLDVPFVLRNNWIVIEVKLGKDEDALKKAPVLHFLLDTGFTDTTVSAEAYDSYKLDLKTLEGARGGTGLTGVGPSSIAVSKSVDATIEFGGATATAQIPVIPMGTDFKNAQIDGAIGSNLIQNSVVLVDYEKQIVQIYPPNEFKAPPRTSGFYAIPITLNSINEPVAEVSLTPFGYSTSRARLALDTGDMGAVTLYSAFTARNKWQDVVSTTASQSGGVGGRIEVSTGKLKSLTFGNTTLGQPPADFSASTAGLTARTEEDGQLGGRVFRRFTMIFDYAHQTLYVRPNASASGPFPTQYYFGFMRSRTAEPPGAYTIGSIEPDSPAANAELHVGDIIYSIDGTTISTLSDEDISARLQESGKPRTFEIVRGAQRLKVAVTPIAY